MLPAGFGPSTRAPAYAAVKAAMMSYTTSQAAMLARQGVRVNCIVPGGVLTEINVRAGLLSEDEAAQLVALALKRDSASLGAGGHLLEKRPTARLDRGREGCADRATNDTDRLPGEFEGVHLGVVAGPSLKWF